MHLEQRLGAPSLPQDSQNGILLKAGRERAE